MCYYEPVLVSNCASLPLLLIPELVLWEEWMGLAELPFLVQVRSNETIYAYKGVLLRQTPLWIEDWCVNEWDYSKDMV